MPAARWLDENESRAWRGLQLMQLQLSAALSRDLAAESSLSYRDFIVLVALTDQPDGRMRAFELGRVLGWEKSRLSHHISRMEERGLVERVKCSSDRRGAHIGVTELGRKAIKAAAPGHVEGVRRRFIDFLTPNEIETLTKISDKVLDGLQQECDAAEA